ncbi:MAG: DUF3943 domain-containing protein [Candidatus Marinimicrobia bacterium]|jgi:hypothetical protein|nr:DUF3943 domain-containing protein [Candidatus Neomarinimicrobiota bacterium]MBT4067526.1 DUF3943 domain-containing protein [Candidatus Neomarinimicrobiota bacterium]MBT4795038.1 DUF3943 domain-containing protein [Candidatus Neomarinimicrobiota bacterium]MBT6930268.1 DUF3943 domain-containing protein [Candidatus Neomarinimicrobiota bacterium]MBT7112453.1 DUF3943 domain-containing protein [Candidatus Neomarinimicrobiota bacterium]
MRRQFIIGSSLLVFLSISNIVSANNNTENNPVDLSTHKRVLTQAISVDASIWAYNSYIAKEPWAKISIQSLKNNIEHGWVIDEDEFDVNQFGHPYQGSLVYTAARAQGLGFWESIPYPIFSSFIWEIGLETEYPSINDMITTPLSGITYGEISHRLSQLILGVNPAISNEIIALIVNPSLGLNRLIGGKRNYPKGDLYSFDYTAGISLGAGSFLINNDALLFPRRFARFHIFYGNPFDKDKLTKPFDYFSFVGIVNFGIKEFVGEVYSSGLLLRLNNISNTNYSQLLGVFKNYDFMNHDDFKVSSSSIGLGLIQNIKLSHNLSLYNEVATSVILLGSAGDMSDDEIYQRDYYYGPGISGKFILMVKKQGIGNIYMRLKRYYIFNLEKFDKAIYENVNLAKAGFQINILPKYSVGGEFTAAMKKSIGNISINEFQRDSIFRLYFIYNFNSQAQNNNA